MKSLERQTDKYLFKIGTARRVIDHVRAAIQQWPQFAADADLPENEMADRRKQLLLLA
jgi:serine/threonine-protein kinase HipA